MKSAWSLAISVFGIMLLAPLIHARDLSLYRKFQFGTNLAAVAKQTGMDPSEAKVLHNRPALIQELWWHCVLSSSLPQTDSVTEVVFSFYNGELFRMVVNYDRNMTEGLTDADMVEAISAEYGAATRPAEEIIPFSSSLVYNDSERVVARWEDAQYSFNLFRYSYQPVMGMVAFSKERDALAKAAVVEAIRLDKQEAPQREVERQKKEDGERRAAQEKARLANKPAFRP
jgi:hypothetical protein